jgi:hypothetical protein
LVFQGLKKERLEREMWAIFSLQRGDWALEGGGEKTESFGIWIALSAS